VLFNSLEFAVFLPIALVVFYLLPVRMRSPWLLLASYVFYAAHVPIYLFLLVWITLASYVGARVIESSRHTRWPLVVGVMCCLGTLGVFKYADFFIDTVGSFWSPGASFSTLDIVLPMGVSFYVFQAVSYLIDVHRGRAAERSLLNVSLYLAFFPQLVAGPIMRPDDLIPQVSKPKGCSTEDIQLGTWFFVRGLLKKVVLADNLAPLVDTVYADPSQFATVTCWIAAYAYAFQIYLDFSGYTDIAMGVGRFFGIKIIKNFDAPYWAISPRDFWRRWHISLSTWLRDYLYIPLGGSRHGRTRTAVALMATMGLGGLWHGAAWTFVAWGLYHGVLLSIDRAGAFKRIGLLCSSLGAPLSRLLQTLFMFQLTCVGWVLFRAQTWDAAMVMLERMFVWHDGAVIGRRVAILTVLCAVVHGGTLLRFPDRLLRPGPIFGGAVVACAAAVVLICAPGATPFLYFQF
jgi:alginate O-acetyltransferase complex protein AlgI